MRFLFAHVRLPLTLVSRDSEYCRVVDFKYVLLHMGLHLQCGYLESDLILCKALMGDSDMGDVTFCGIARMYVVGCADQLGVPNLERSFHRRPAFRKLEASLQLRYYCQC
jgi:hypothetical protein